LPANAQSGFQLSAIKPITKGTDDPVNQSKFLPNTCSRRKARENECERVTIGFGFTSDWMTKWRVDHFKPITKLSKARTKPKPLGIPSIDTRVKKESDLQVT